MIGGLVTAISFLTQIPLPIDPKFQERDLKASILFFPFVGFFIGCIASIPYYYLTPISKDVASFLAVLVLVLVTGGLHIDGLSDTCDGLFSNRDRDRMLEIMKDSRVGAFGVLSIVIFLFAEYIFLSNMREIGFFPIAVAAGNSRLCVAYIVSVKKSARPGGMGDLFQRTKPFKNFLIGGVIYILLLMLINPIFVVSTIACFIVVELVSTLSYSKINGVTGDIYGAANTLGELGSIVALWVISL